MKRDCEICGSHKTKHIYTPIFFIPGKIPVFKYDIVLCQQCGFLFSDNIPTREEYDAFYKNNYKYAYNKNIPDGLREIYRDIFSASNVFLSTYYARLDKNRFKIIDVGCSIGYILSLFKDAGFKNIRGIEPSLYCKSIAKKLYGINIINCSLFEFKNQEKFDLIIMTGVLEHICNLNETVNKAASLLNSNGLLMVAVPTVDKFSKNPCVPFDEFSLEHINYFNKNTLSNLMGKHYLENIYSKSIAEKFYNSRAVLCFFKKTGKISKIKKDSGGYLAIKQYVVASEKRLKVVNKKVDCLVKSNEKVAIWGVGSLTSRLLVSTNLLKANIKFLVDSNKVMQGKKINNIRIFPPSIFRKLNNDYTVLILSYIYRKEIKNILVEKYGFKGKIITF